MRNRKRTTRGFCQGREIQIDPLPGDRYKNYLGLDKPIQTEFATRLVNGQGKLIGVLNLESDLPNAFNLHHRQRILQLSRDLAPMVEVFEERLRHNSIMHRSVAASTATYLDSLASVFRHGIGTPLANLRTDIDLLTNLIDLDLRKQLDAIQPHLAAAKLADASLDKAYKIETKATSALKRLLAVGAQVSSFATDFANNISGFGQIGRMDIVKLVKDTIDLAQNSMLVKMDADIRIVITSEEKVADVFCSPLLKQHLYCILSNAVLSIQERMTSDPRPGRITVEIARQSPDDEAQEIELNSAWTVKIRDDGSGVSVEQLEKLRRFRAGTRFRKSKGMGYGLAAAQRYMASINGRILLNGELGKYFEVVLFLDEYRDEVHGPLSVYVL